MKNSNINLVCMQHPHYDGKDAPNLSCKSCCILFIQMQKLSVSQKTEPAKQDAHNNLFADRGGSIYEKAKK